MKKKPLQTLIPLFLAASLLGSCGGNGNNPASPTDTQGPSIGSIQGPASVYTNELADYSIDPADPSGVDSGSYEWDWGADGSIESTDATFSYAPTTTGTYEIKVSVADNLGNRSEAYKDVTVTEPAFSIEYIVYDANGSEGAGLYDAEQTGVSDALIEKMIDATGYSLPGSTAIEFNASADSDSDGTSDLDEILANYASLSSTEKDSVNPDSSGYQPFITSDTNQDQYTHLIKIKREG